MQHGEQLLKPLDWWRENERAFPSLAELASVVFSVPGSQIECERVFSLAGLITAGSRNRLGAENMDMLVFISKNANRKEMIEDAVYKVFGQHVGVKILREARVDRMFSKEQDIMKSLQEGCDDRDEDEERDGLLSSAVEKMIEDMQLEEDFEDSHAPAPAPSLDS